ncbi:uncharacterized protein B0H18DRAFT_1214063 [Fomitopsis serialis]|uniref:uncharacterized protein n=1 Tax=Fomitopsis serialis TaxID=139415 RepID=UPI0020089A22|nr:uncharacterized protein B0H18DRAFT_1214063 [Neoantrodia serialis]KAH9918841.1 hypothetical protein B0H18DRAFT_1214063 [Neoantrodia serialis]
MHVATVLLRHFAGWSSSVARRALLPVPSSVSALHVLSYHPVVAVPKLGRLRINVTSLALMARAALWRYLSRASFDMDRVQIRRNASVAPLYEDAIRNEDVVISARGSLINISSTSPYTTRPSPGLRPTRSRSSINRERAVDYLNTLDNIYAYDGSSARAYHGLFMASRPCASNRHVGRWHHAPQNNMLIRPTEEELKDSGEPDYNAGELPVNRFTKGSSSASTTQLPLHSSPNIGIEAPTELVEDAAPVRRQSSQFVYLRICGSTGPLDHLLPPQLLQYLHRSSVMRC